MIGWLQGNAHSLSCLSDPNVLCSVLPGGKPVQVPNPGIYLETGPGLLCDSGGCALWELGSGLHWIALSKTAAAASTSHP